MSLRKVFFWLGTCLLLCFCVTIAVKGQATKTVKVDCTKGKSINKALNANKFVFRLIIEIHGICYENVDISDRKRVTLIGDNRDEDGIHGVSTDLDGLTRGNTIQIGRASGVRLENLTISGGARHGISTSYSNAIMVEDCIVVGNARIGLSIGRASSVFVIDSEITGGTREGVLVDAFSRVELTDTFVKKGDGRRSLSARDHSTITMTGGELDESVSITRKSILHLFGVNQTAAMRSNFIDDNSQLRTDCTDPRDAAACVMAVNQTLLLDTSLRDFSNATFANSDIGNLTCFTGSDAFCADSTSDCSSCILATQVDCDAGDSIQAAVDNAQGSELFVSGNCDDGPFVITRDIKLTGPATLSAPAGSFAVLFIDTSRVELRNLTIDDGGYQRGILLQGSRAKMTNVYVEGATFFGIEIQGISSATLSDSEVSYNQNGLLIERSSSVDMSNNNTVENNTIFGMIIKSSSTASIFGGNVFSGNQQGVTVEGNSSIRMGNSTVSNNMFSGVRLQYSSYVDIFDSANTIQGNGFGDVVCETGGIIRTSPQISNTALDVIDVSCIVEGSIF